jgi:imidazoleglycerol-phosphate dehydratase
MVNRRPTMGPVDKLILDNAKRIQENNGYSDQKMADLIGCSRTFYNQVKNGRKPAGGVFYRGILMLLEDKGKGSSTIKREDNNEGRYSCIARQTKETNISLELNIDGSGKYEIDTGIMMFDHMLAQLAQHGRFNLNISATGDDQHHVIEDVAICLGKALGEALGEKGGIVRMADASVTMDDALSMVAVDISGRGYAVLELSFSDNDMAGFPTDLIRHFLESFAIEARLNLHAKVIYGTNDHHKAEALFKALGRALDMATSIDQRISGELPSTKKLLEG